MENTVLEPLDPLGVRYDKAVKHILGDKQVLAQILKGTIDEYSGMDIRDIQTCIDRVKIKEVPVSPGATNSRLAGLPNEDNIPNEGYILFDILFYTMAEGDKRRFLINIEAQGETKKLKYPLETRQAFYIGRELSSQKGRDFTGSNYQDLLPVVAIWICMDADDGTEGLWVSRMKTERVYGDMEYAFPKDLIRIITVKIREGVDCKPAENELIRFLELLLSPQGPEKKIRELRADFGIEVTDETRERMDDMASLLESWGQKKYAEGCAETKNTAAITGAKIAYDQTKSEDVTIKLIGGILGVSAEKAALFFQAHKNLII